MSIFVDEMYIGMMGPRLNLFTPTAKSTYNFRCPICGDSKSNPYKKRGYFIVNPDSNGFLFMCHNCGVAHSLYGFIKIVFPDLFNQYKLESFIADGRRNGEVGERAIMREKPSILIPKEKKLIETSSFSEPVIDVVDLEDDHPAKQYLLKTRKLPVDILHRFQYVDSYKRWIEGVNGTEEKQIKHHPRIMIPYRDRSGDVYRYLARSFTGSFGSKYLYTDLGEGFPFYKGYEINKHKRVYVCEGPIDSMLIDNAMAIGNAAYSRGSFDGLPDYVLVTDNQPRNPQVVASIGKAIDAGHPTVIWPSNMKQKDINDLVISGYTQDQILSLIDENVYQGAKAKVKFTYWKKV